MKERTIKIEFSSRQVVIIVALIALAAIMLPISVQAATGSSVNIVDPTKSTYKAKVSGVGALLTGICSWNNISTPTCATVNNHSLNTVVNGGFVNAGTDIPPLFPLSKVLTISDSTSDFLSAQGGAAFNPNEEVELSGITVSNYSAVPLKVTIQMRHQATTCTAGGGTLAQDLEEIFAAGNQTVHLSFPQPIVAAGDGVNEFCIDAAPSGSNASNSDVRVTIVGYEF